MIKLYTITKEQAAQYGDASVRRAVAGGWQPVVAWAADPSTVTVLLCSPNGDATNTLYVRIDTGLLTEYNTRGVVFRRVCGSRRTSSTETR